MKAKGGDTTVNKKIILPALGVALFSAAALGIKTVNAQTPSPTATTGVMKVGPMTDGLVEKIATKFNLNKADVQTVFDGHHQEMMAEHQKRYEARLDQAVKDGKLTEAQKQLVIQKHNELKSNRQEFKDMSPEEMKAAMQKHHEELKQWAEANGIDMQHLFGVQKGKRMFIQKADVGSNEVFEQVISL